jgi:DNA-binding winged helix-turn-helix (wHTH) protein
MPATGFRFGRHVLDVETGALRRDGVVVPLQTQPARLLILLVERAGSVVTREEIRSHLWADTVVAYDQSINYCIRHIRIALAEDGALVQTIPRRGYRMRRSAVQPVDAAASAGNERQRWGGDVRMRVAAVAAAALVSGFALGSANHGHRSTVRQFVSSHLTHPDRCPYLRFFVRTPPNS